MVEEPMTQARADVLARVRQAIGSQRSDSVDGRTESATRSRPIASGTEEHHCEYAQASELNEDALLELFASRIVHYDGAVTQCSEVDLRGTIERSLSMRGKQRILVPVGLDRGWLPPTIDFATDTDTPAEDLDRCEGVMTGCTVAIAATGTIVLTHGPGQGRRALTLVPDYYLSIVFADQIVEAVPEGIRRAAALTPRLITTISGPSATADIEMTRISGVHGPRTLDVIIVRRGRRGYGDAG
jgi:L-lactate dehydrogenase complex protein LldG